MADPGQLQQLSMKMQDSLGIPPGFKTYSSFPFSGMNQEASRLGMEDAEFYWRENLIKTGPGNLRALWDIGASIYSPPTGKTIVWFFFYNIAAINYAAVFLSDGTAIQVNVATLAQTVISSVPGTFYAGGQLPACCQSGSQYLLITNNITPNSYWIWDGMLLYGAGGIGPDTNITDGGAGYTSAPTVLAFGGSGSGITATASIANGSVVAVQITNPGINYLPDDTVQFQFSGGGTDTGAILTAVLSVGAVDSIELLAGGSGGSPGTYALTFTGGAGTGAAGTYTIGAGGAVTSVDLTAGGANYTGTPAITFTHGSVTGAQALAILAGGTVASVTVTNGGTNFTGTPTLTFVGGGGTGATATAVMTTGAISSVTVTNAGTGYTSVPAIEIQTGLNNAASAIAELLPFGVSGSSIETFQSRVWLPFPNEAGRQNNGGVFLVSAPSSLTDFATSDGGLIFTSNDRFLREYYANIRQSNGYLYPFGDSSVDVISNVQTSGNPTTTTFNYQNVDPQIGMAWRDSCQDFSRTILFANSLGVFGLYGGAATKISTKMDKIFEQATFPPTAGAVMPSSAVANIYTLRAYLILMTILDPFTNTNRNVMLSWDEHDWFIVSQSLSFIYLGTQEINSDLTAWGTDGNVLVPLMQTPSALITKKLSSKLFGATDYFITKQAVAFYVQGEDRSAGNTGFSLLVNVDNETGSYPITNNPVNLSTSTPFWGTSSGDVYGQELGYTLTSVSLDFQLENVSVGCVPWAAIVG